MTLINWLPQSFKQTETPRRSRNINTGLAQDSTRGIKTKERGLNQHETLADSLTLCRSSPLFNPPNSTPLLSPSPTAPLTQPVIRHQNCNNLNLSMRYLLPPIPRISDYNRKPPRHRGRDGSSVTQLISERFNPDTAESVHTCAPRSVSHCTPEHELARRGNLNMESPLPE